MNIAGDKRDVRRRRGILRYSSNDEEVNLYFTLYFHHPPDLLRDVGNDREKTSAIVLKETVEPRSLRSHFPQWQIS